VIGGFASTSDTAGLADYLCHRAVRIESTSGVKESLLQLLHLLQVGEMAIPTLAAIFLEINALVIAVMIILALVLLFEALPYLEELVRSIGARRRAT
jgi:hypothetical protein